MSLRRSFVAASLLLPSFVGTAAAAEASEPRAPKFSDHPLAIEARSGLATSVGLIGVVAELTPLDWLTLGGGVGDNGYGAILGAHLRLRPLIFEPTRHASLTALTLESAYSRGRHGGFDFDPTFGGLCEGSPDDPKSQCYRPSLVPQRIDWFQLEVGVENRLASGFTFRFSAGGATALGWPAWHCTNLGQPAACLPNGRSEPGRSLLVLTMALGYAF